MPERRGELVLQGGGVISVRGIELDYSQSGEGTPVLLVHETATSRSAWRGVVDALDDRVSALFYDRRGWGQSTAPDGYQRTTIEEQAEDGVALLDARDAAPAVLVGAGLGALVALDLALRHPELALGLVLVEPPALGLVPEATEPLSADRVAMRDAVNEGGTEAALDLYLSGGLEAIGAGAARLPAELTGQARERPRILFAELGAATSWSMPLSALREAELPSLIVTAPSTPHLLREAAAALGARLAGSESREVDEERMAPHLGDPDGVGALALELAS